MNQTIHSTKLDLSEGNALGLRLQGKLTADDYDQFLPEIERVLEKHDKVRLLIELKGVKGITPKALWKDLKFDIRHFRDIERLAVVGEEKWDEVLTTLSKPFVGGEVKHFQPSELRSAWSWIKS